MQAGERLGNRERAGGLSPSLRVHSLACASVFCSQVDRERVVAWGECLRQSGPGSDEDSDCWSEFFKSEV